MTFIMKFRQVLTPWCLWQMWLQTKTIFYVIMVAGVFYPTIAFNKYMDEAENPSVNLASSIPEINLGILDLLDAIPNQATGTFEVLSSPQITYDVWISVPKENLDPIHHVYLAKNGEFALPLNVVLTGDVINVDSAQNQANNPHWVRPHSGSPRDGDNVKGSMLSDIYHVTFSENIDLHHVYSEIPQGRYQMPLTVHVVMN